jgi:hypothetical protein
MTMAEELVCSGDRPHRAASRMCQLRKSSNARSRRGLGTQRGLAEVTGRHRRVSRRGIRLQPSRTRSSGKYGAAAQQSRVGTDG